MARIAPDRPWPAPSALRAQLSQPRTRRAVGAVGAFAVVGGGVLASVAQRAGPGADFVSTLGVKGRRLAWVYRAGEGVAALACLALGATALSAARGSDAVPPDRHPWREVLLRREPRGAALAASGCLLATVAVVPCSPECPIPLVEGTHIAARDWLHVPAAIAAFYLWPVAAHGRTRAVLLANLAPLVPLTMTDPHGPATAVLQRTMVVLAAVALLTWRPTRDSQWPSDEDPRRILKVSGHNALKVPPGCRRLAT